MPANLLTSGAKRLWGLGTQSLSFLFKYVLIVILVFVREKTIFSKVSFIFDAFQVISCLFLLFDLKFVLCKNNTRDRTQSKRILLRGTFY